jgi:hypothetical protein
VQSFKQSAIDAYFAVHDSYLANTDANLAECDSALETEQAGGASEDTWVAAEGNADENLNSLSPSSQVSVRLLTSATRDFTPWRGPGHFPPGKEKVFNFRADNLLRDAYFWYGPINTLDLANTFVKGHDCGGARAQVEKARADADLERKILGHQFGKLRDFVQRWVEP